MKDRGDSIKTRISMLLLITLTVAHHMELHGENITTTYMSLLIGTIIL